MPRGLAGVGRSSATAWDYFHINSLAKGKDGHYLVSARHASTVFKINSTDGSVIWRLGGNHSDFALGEGVRFGFQHHARYFIEDTTTDDQPHNRRDVISLFDNSVYGSESAAGTGNEIRINPYSRGKYIALDHAAQTATLVRALEPPAVFPGLAKGDVPILARSQGSLQSLPGGGDFVNWGSEGQITEYDSQGKPVFHAFLGRGFLRERLQNYRAFRFNWTGISPETPAIYAEESLADTDSESSGTVRLFVSWNGDTVTQSWRFTWTEEVLEGESNGKPAAQATKVLREKVVLRRGFETSTRVYRPSDVRISSIRAEALDAAGRVLGVSSLVGVQQALSRSIVSESERQVKEAAVRQKTMGFDIEL